MTELNINGKSDEDKNKSQFVEEFKVAGWGMRHTQCLILMVALTIGYSLRACMGVALVGMIESKPSISLENNTDLSIDLNNNKTDGINVRGSDYEAHGFLNALMLTPPYPQFDWSKKTQDVVISSFFFGYMLLQIPAGQLAHRFGSRRLISGAMLINCAASLLFPTVTFYGGWITAAIFRMLLGLSQAVLMPSIHTFLGKWTPLEERGRLSGLIYGAQALGPVLGLPLTGFIAASPLGWPGIFRFYGALAGISGGIIWFVTADSPAQHKKISVAERSYIEEALKQKGGNNKCLKVPWKKLLRHRGMYAIIVAHIGQTWGQLTLYSEVPAFMAKVMGVNIKANGMLTALPFLVMYFTNFFFSWFFDMLIVKKYLGVTWSRKLANSIGCIGSSVGLIILAYAPRDIYVVETIMVILCGLKISSHYGFLVNHIDISPNFAGTMMSLSNFCSNSVGVLAPIVAGLILTDVTSVYLWRKVFFVSSGLYFFTNVVYCLLGTAELADWNEPEPDKIDEEADAMIKEKEREENR